MKKLLLLTLLCIPMTGCAIVRTSEIDARTGTRKTTTIATLFNRSTVSGFKSTQFSFDGAKSETQPEALKAAAEAIGIAAGVAAKTAAKP